MRKQTTDRHNPLSHEFSSFTNGENVFCCGTSCPYSCHSNESLKILDVKNFPRKKYVSFLELFSTLSSSRYVEDSAKCFPSYLKSTTTVPINYICLTWRILLGPKQFASASTGKTNSTLPSFLRCFAVWGGLLPAFCIQNPVSWRLHRGNEKNSIALHFPELSQLVCVQQSYNICVESKHWCRCCPGCLSLCHVKPL